VIFKCLAIRPRFESCGTPPAVILQPEGADDVTVWDCVKSPEGSRPIQLQI
jgi:hypothetical protein